MNWLLNAMTPVRQSLHTIGKGSAWAAGWSVVSNGALAGFLITLLIGQLFSLPFAVVAAVPLAFGSALLHTIAMSSLGGVYWESRKLLTDVPEYADTGLHSRIKRGALLGLLNQNCSFLAVPLAQLALFFPALWIAAFGMYAISLLTARYVARTSSLAIRSKESSRSTGAAWL